MKGSIETRVKAVIARYFNLPPSKVGLDAAFVGDLGGDPLDLIELGYQLEAAFNVRLSPSQRDALTTPRAPRGSGTNDIVKRYSRGGFVMVDQSVRRLRVRLQVGRKET